MAESTLLNVVLLLPLAGIAGLCVLPKGRDGAVRTLTLAVMLVQFVLAAWLYLRFDATTAGSR